jgi:PEGA domain
VRVVQDERSVPKGTAKPAPKDGARDAGKEPPREKTPPRPAALSAEDDSDDARTIPATDLDELERKRAAKKAAAADAPGALATSPPTDPAPFEHEDKTSAGVPPPPLPAAARGREADERAAALLAKVEAMAAADEAATYTALPAAGTASADEDAFVDETGAVTADILEPKPSMVVGSNGRVDDVRPVRPAGRPAASLDGQTSDTPPPGNVRASARPVPARAGQAPTRSRPHPVAAPQQKLPTVVYAAVAATIVMCVASITGLVLIWRTMPTAGQSVVEYVVVHVTSDPPGAVVTVDGDAALSGTAPLQVPLEKIVGAEHVVEVKLDGHASATQTFKLVGDGDVQPVNVKLDAN